MHDEAPCGVARLCLRHTTRPRRSAGLLALLCGLLIFAGCTPQSAPEDTPGQPMPATATVSSPEHVPGVVDPDNITDQEILLLKVECLREKGWDIDVDLGDNSYSPNVPAEQLDSFNEDRLDCDEQYAHLLDAPLVDPDDPRWEEVYETQLATAECLRGQGYEGQQPPTLEVWKEQMLTGAADVWLAYNAVPPDVGASEWERLQTECPQKL